MNHDIFRDLFLGILIYVTLRWIGFSDTCIQGIVAAVLLADKIANVKIRKL